MHADDKFPDGDRRSVTFNLGRGFRPTKAIRASSLKGKNDFQVVYLQDPHYSINSMPISFVIQLTRCRSAASLTTYVSSTRPSSHSDDLLRYSFNLWASLEALIASVYTNKVV